MRRAAAALLALAGLGCPGAPRAVVYDLAERLPVAEREASRETILFGTPSSEPHLAEGFFRWAGGEGDRFLWARTDVAVSLRWERPEPRLAVVDMRPFEGVTQQGVDVRLNGRSVARFGLNDYRHSYPVPLPAEAQVPGENRLAFFFDATASRAETVAGSDDPGQLAAAFYGLSVGAADDPGLQDLLRRDAPRPFSRSDAGGVPGFSVVGPASVTYGLRLPEAAELALTPVLHPLAGAAGRPVGVRITLASESGEERTLWSAALRGESAPDELRLPLPGETGEIVALGLHVDAPEPGGLPWVVWRAPRVLGRVAPAAEALPPRERPPVPDSVLLVVLDAARAGQLGAYGYSRDTTPEIDRIAAEGVVVEQAFTPAVYTLGAMSALWTSQEPDRHRSETSFSARLPPGRLTLAELLSAQSVHTAGFVANAVAGRAFGFDRGFVEFHEVFRESGSDAVSFREPLDDFLERRDGGPLFLYVHFREPHFPYDPPPPFDTRFGPEGPIARPLRSDSDWITAVNRGERVLTAEERAHLVSLYDGNLAHADAELGRLRRRLEAAGLWDRMAVIVIADHGEELGEHGWIGHNVHLFEESVRVPMILRVPGLAGGRRVPGLADLRDVAPTVADLFGVLGRGGSDRAFEGRSLLPQLAGGAGRQTVLSRTVWDRPRYALRDARYKLVYDTRTGESRLYDLVADPGERHDRSAETPLVASFYRQEMYLELARLAQRPSAKSAARPTDEQCENLQALGYVDATCESVGPVPPGS